MTEMQLGAMWKRIEQAIKQHNDNKWVREGDFASPEDLDALSRGDNDESLPPVPWMRVPSYFVPKSCQLPNLFVKVPHQNDENNVRSLNNILELMACVGGSDRLQTSWRTARDRLARRFKLNVIENPSVWGPKDESKESGDVEATEARKEMVKEAIEKHNDDLGDRRRKRKAEGPHDITRRPKQRLGNKRQVRPLPQSNPATSPDVSQHDASNGTVTIEEVTSQGGGNTQPLRDSGTAAHAHDEHGWVPSSARVGIYDPVREEWKEA
ncbi:hypothetical protein H0H93_005112 [Arthromyces matolae]|nr:hypothetical protein H0H93_005112 [Arthromyces matolae]